MISVVIPTHNRADLLPRAIKSVLNQTIKDVEIIVVSDGSTDGTDALMHEFESQDKRIRYISYFPGRNGNYARNQGILASIGEYVAFLDDDDEWLPTKLEKQLKIMESDPEIGIVYTGTHNVYVDLGISYDSVPVQHGDLSKDILLYNIVGSTTTVMVRKSVLNKTGLFDENLGAMQDYDLWVRVCQVAKVGVVTEPLVNYYNYNNSGQISANVGKYELAYDKVNQKYEQLLNEKLSGEERKHKLACQMRALAIKALRNGNGKEARAYYVKSINYRFEIRSIWLYISTFLGYNTHLKLRSVR